MIKTEKINKKRLCLLHRKQVYLYISLFLLDDINWLKNFKTQLKNYDTTVIYKQKNNQGRFYGCGLQSFPRDIRKYCSGEFYVDIDIVNFHLILIENIMINNNNINVPNFLK